MADTPVDTVDASTTEASPSSSGADTSAPAGENPADGAPAEKPKKKAAAKKAPAKKAAAKKAPAKKAAAKKAPAKKAAAKTAKPEKADQSESGDQAERPAEPSTEATSTDESSTGAAVLFKAPETAPARKKAKPKSAPKDTGPKEKPEGRAGEKAGEKAEEKAEEPAVSETPESGDPDEGDEGEGGTPARRRRRRGGRRRRKPGSGASGASGDSDDDDASDDASDEDAATDADATGDSGEPGEKSEGGGSSSSSRRRRRRRREGDSESDSGDDAHTVTRVRKPRSPEDEITAVSGSTRLEAKKQRRREGREAGRRRAPIVSEAEFLARRESVERVMVVRQRKDLTQIAVLEDKVLVEHYVARESQTSLIGNVYLGRVQNVLPSMEAAFIDIGKGRNAVLYAGEVNWSALGHKEGTPRKIESVLQSGQTVLVQVTKDPIGHKGARLTSQISLAGRFLVYVPDGTTSGISRKLPDTERGRLKSLLKEIVPESAGVIVRTAAEGASEDELTRDVERLKARWEDVEKKAAKGNAPQLLYGEPDLTLKVVRDLFTEDFAKLVVQGDDAWETVHEYVEHVAPDLAERLEHYDARVEGEADKPDVFATYRIDEQIAKGLDRKVWLPSGGSLIIDRTEAMTVIDVNTGKFTGSGGNLEETVTKNNLEAAEEIVRQLRLRDIGGIIVVDFIDMVLESNRDLVLRRLVECLGRDRTRHQVAEVTSLGLVQMTRKRIGTGLLEAFSETCDHCQGRGIVVHDLPVEPRRGGGGDDESRRTTRRRRGKGGGQADEQPAKSVPSPKDIAAMAKPPSAELEESEESEEPNEAEEPAENLEPLELNEPGEPAGAPVDEDAAAAETAAAVEAVEGVEAPAPGPEPVVEQEAPTQDEAPAGEPATDETAVDEPVDEPVVEPAAEPAAPKVVTRTRRRAASRPAGPPVSAAVGDIGAPVEDGVVEPQDVPMEPGVEAATEDAHVEHVPIKRKGTRKR